jgi:hypothetical protein
MPSGTPINHARWGAFLKNLTVADVVVARTRSGNAYLRRNIGDRVLAVPLPSNFDEADPDKSGYVGNMRFHNICRRLEIDKHKYFRGWYDVL